METEDLVTCGEPSKHLSLGTRKLRGELATVPGGAGGLGKGSGVTPLHSIAAPSFLTGSGGAERGHFWGLKLVCFLLGKERESMQVGERVRGKERIGNRLHALCRARGEPRYLRP